MEAITRQVNNNFIDYLTNFNLNSQVNLFGELESKTQIDFIEGREKSYPRFTNEYWTSKQRQANSLHEIAYRACFKAQLPRFFIELLTDKHDIVYDCFAGRGTTIIEAALLGRQVIANDVNPLSKILCKPRLELPDIKEIKERLSEIPLDETAKAEIDLSMFFHPQTEAEIISLKSYLELKQENGNEDFIDSWVRMVATNRLTGHSSGFFSVYTLPPNQAVSPKRQAKINEQRKQTPTYRDTKNIILRKSALLMKNISLAQKKSLSEIAKGSLFFTSDARYTDKIPSNLVKLTLTSPPFLDVVQYSEDNWLRCWFNSIPVKNVEITMAKTIEKWCEVMNDVFREIYRITLKNGFVAFEVGEVKNGKIKLDEYVVTIGEKAGFKCEGIVINQQIFTKTSNIWGVKNNDKGTNTNRIVVFSK